MADAISDDFVLANGIAAYALARETLAFLEVSGVPRDSLIAIIMSAHNAVQKFGDTRTHAAIPIAAELLQDAARQVQARPLQ